MHALLLCLWLTAETPAAPTSPPVVTASESAEEDLRRAQNAYAYGRYTDAIELLTGVLTPLRLYSDNQIQDARRTLALSYYLVGRAAEAQEEFLKLLLLDPDYALDPFTIAPPIIDLLEKVRTEHAERLNRIREERVEAGLARAPEPGYRQTIATTVVEHSELATFMPFGIGQFYNGDVGWGVAFAITHTVLLGLNVASYIWQRSQRVDERPGYPPSRANQVQAATITQFASAALLGVTWTLGVFQARLNFIPQTRSRTVKDEPVNTRPSPKPIDGASMHLGFDF